MRLTLRTLLAYLDDVLEPTQAKELGEKIAESSVATALVNRMREVLRRRRLSAPAVQGPGSGVDANRIGEYLDNTLPPDAVADIERVCLESDVHLAEVAACHQILTLVLGEPVDVPLDSRERMYALGPKAATLEVDEPTERPTTRISSITNPVMQRTTIVPASGPVEVPSVVDDFRNNGLPEYLRPETTWRSYLPYGALAAVLLLWAGLVYFDPPISPKRSPAEIAADRNNTELLVDDNHELDVPLTEEPPREIPAGRAVVNGGTNVPAPMDDVAGDPGDQPIAPRTASRGPTIVTPRTTETKRVPMEPVGDEPAGGEAVAALNGPTPETPAERPDSRKLPTPTDDLVSADLGEAGAVGPKPAAPEAPSEFPAGDLRQPGRAGSSAAARPIPVPDSEPAADDSALASATPAPTRPTEPEPLTPEPASAGPVVCKYLSRTGVAIVSDRSAESYMVLGRDRSIETGDVVAVPEPFEGEFDVGERYRLRIPGGTTMLRLGPTAAADHGWALIRGRMHLSTDGAARATERTVVALQIRDRMWKIELLAPDTRLSVAMVPRDPQDFEEQFDGIMFKAAVVLERGVVRVTGDSTGKVLLKTPGWFSLTPGVAFGPNDPVDPEGLNVLERQPAWLVASSASTVARNYAKTMEEKFYDPATPVEQTIVGAIDDKRPLVSRLAVDCLVQLQTIPLLVDIIHKTDHEESRRAAIAALRAWLPEVDENRAILKTELERRFTPGDAGIVYRLLWGYGEKHFRDPDTSRQLVEWLRHDHIAVRELAWLHIQRSGRRDFEYRPNVNAAQRNTAVNRIVTQLRGNALLTKPAGT
jgi:hypothetical protein